MDDYIYSDGNINCAGGDIKVLGEWVEGGEIDA